MSFHGGMPSPMDRKLMPSSRHEGPLPVRMFKSAVNFAIEMAGGRRPFEPVREGGAVAVAHQVDPGDPLNRLPAGTIEPDEYGIRDRLPERPPHPDRN